MVSTTPSLGNPHKRKHIKLLIATSHINKVSADQFGYYYKRSLKRGRE